MSTDNIISIEPDPMAILGASEGIPVASIVVTFQTHSQGKLSYRYTGVAAAAIMEGADPADYFGTPV